MPGMLTGRLPVIGAVPDPWQRVHPNSPRFGREVLELLGPREPPCAHFSGSFDVVLYHVASRLRPRQETAPETPILPDFTPFDDQLAPHLRPYFPRAAFVPR